MNEADYIDLINTIIAEAAGEGKEGMRRVGETIINRGNIRGQSFGDIVRAPYQFTGYTHPGPQSVKDQKDPSLRRLAAEAWELALLPGDPTGGADHYFNPSQVQPAWADSMQHTGDYGGHAFYTSGRVPRQAPVAPNPFAAPAGRTSLPTYLFADTFNAASGAQGRAALNSQIGPAQAQSWLNKNGTVTTPAEAVLSKQMATNTGISQSTATSIADMFGQTRGTKLPPVTQVAARPSTYMGQSFDSVASSTKPGLAAALEAFLRPPAAPTERSTTIATLSTKPNVLGQPGAYAGQERGTVSKQPMTVATRPQTYAGQERTSAPSVTTMIASLFGPSSSPQTFAGQDGKPAATPSAKPPRQNIAGFAGPVLSYASGTVDPNKDQTRLGVPAPTTRTITETVENPEWTEANKRGQIPAGMTIHTGSRDSVAQRAAGVAAAQNIQRWITRTREVPVAAPAKPRAPVAAPVIQPRAATPAPTKKQAPAPTSVVGKGTITAQQLMSVVDQYRALGLSPAQAYAAANSKGSGGYSVEDRVSGKSNGGSSAPQSLGS